MRRAILLLAAVVVAAGLVTGASYGVLRLKANRITPVSPEPVIDCPSVVDAGEAEIYSVALGRFTVTNRGGRELVLNDIRTSCTCTGLERERDGTLFRVDEVRVQPGETVDLAIRQGVRGPVGTAFDTPVRFHTNDPASPEHTVRLLISRVTGGVETSPKSVAIGSVAVGAKAVHVIDVTDESLTPRLIERVVSSAPDRVRVRLIPRSSPNDPLARIEVEVDSRSAGPVDERVEIYSAGRSFPTVVPVSGFVAAVVEISPKTPVVPRQSEGRLTFTATALCRSSQGLPLLPRVESCPADISVEVGSGEGSPVRRLTITWNPALASAGNPAPRIVQFKVMVDGTEHAAEITVHCQPEGAP